MTSKSWSKNYMGLGSSQIFMWKFNPIYFWVCSMDFCIYLSDSQIICMSIICSLLSMKDDNIIVLGYAAKHNFLDKMIVKKIWKKNFWWQFKIVNLDWGKTF